MKLTQKMRDYLYEIGLGHSGTYNPRTVKALLRATVIKRDWHGAANTFVLTERGKLLFRRLFA